jgi:stalled ribosome rescue protein Dom34
MPSTLHTRHKSYAIVWIDHRQADVFRIHGGEENKVVVHSHHSVQRLHHQNPDEGSAVHPADTEFFARILSAVESPAGVLVAGPGQAKYALRRYLREKRPDVAAHVDHEETGEPPGEASVIALALAQFPLTQSAGALDGTGE